VEPARPATEPGGHHRPLRFRTRVGAVVGAFCAISLVLPATAGHAKPKPPDASVKDLKDQASKLHDQMEQLTEQYNGLKVRYQQATRAAQVAQDNAKRQDAALQTVQQRVGQLAATSYMNGGVDPSVAFATATDPQAMLDQASTLNYFAAQDGTKVQTLAQAMQGAVRAHKAAQDRATQVKDLQSQLDQRKKKLSDMYGGVRDKIAKKDPTQLANLAPIVGGSSKAQRALALALAQRGKPYVWGAAGPSTFDCSGLTMWAYGKVGINLPHYTGSQWNSGTHISSISQLQPGDLVFFYADLHHMGMYIGKGMMVHAPHTGDVVRVAPIAGRPFAGGVRVA
jgi:cell wall-associated NlpC family hydrolase